MTTPALPGARWLLVDDYTGEVDVTLGVCHDIDGLFVDPEPIPHPRLSLCSAATHRVG